MLIVKERLDRDGSVHIWAERDGTPVDGCSATVRPFAVRGDIQDARKIVIAKAKGE